MVGWMDRQMDGWIDRQMDGKIVRWMDRQINRQIEIDRQIFKLEKIFKYF